MGVVGRLDQYASMLATEFDETTANNPSITGLGTYYATEFNENIVDIVRDGLVLNLDAGNLASYPGTSAELVTNGTFDSNVVGWTTSGSTNTWSSGKMQITRTAGGGTSSYQVISTVPGVTYAISAEVNSSGSRGDLYATDGTGWGGTTLFAAFGTYLSTLTLSGTFTATSNTTSIGFRVDNNNTSIIVDNVSVSPLWTDVSGNGNNGTLTNGPTYSSANGGSIVFDGTNDFIDFTSDSNLLPTAGLTVSAWFKTTVDDTLLLMKSSGTGSTDGYTFIGSGTSSIIFFVNNITVFTPSAITTGVWINIVATWTPSTSLLMYQNGTQVASNTTSIPASITNPSTNLEIARRIGTGDYWNGNIAQVSIYNRALTAAEISQNYNALATRYELQTTNVTAPLSANLFMRQNTDKSVIVYNEIDEITDFRDIVTSGLVLDLDAGMNSSFNNTGTTWNDLSGNSNNGTLVNGPTYSSANGGSIVFDGTNEYVNLGNILNFTTENFSFNCFFYLTSTTTNSAGNGPVLFYKGDYQQNGYYAQVGFSTPTSNIFFATNQSGAIQTTSTTSGSLVVGGWNCVTIVRNGSSVTNYINGLNATSGAGTHINPASSSSNFQLAWYGTGNIFANIRIASFQAYNRALSATEVAQNYNALKHRFGL